MANFEFSEPQGDGEPSFDFNFNFSLESDPESTPAVENTTSSELPPVDPENPWSFLQEFNGAQIEPSDEEKIAVRCKFENIIDDFFLAHVDEVIRIGVDGDNLILNYPLPENRFLETELIKRDAVSQIDISMAKDDRPEGFASLYEIEDNGAVIRTDRYIGDIPPDLELASVDPESYKLQSQIYQESRRNLEQNSALEQELGLNRQFVGMDEINALSKVLESSLTLSMMEE